MGLPDNMLRLNPLAKDWEGKPPIRPLALWAWSLPQSVLPAGDRKTRIPENKVILYHYFHGVPLSYLFGNAYCVVPSSESTLPQDKWGHGRTWKQWNTKWDRSIDAKASKYSRGLKSEQFSWMWANRLRKSRHDRVTAGSQQSIKTQGDCLHLKDTKYHYNKHERAHPSHCRLLLIV